MARRNFRKRSGVIVDQCRDHGTWLDGHELERIAGFVFSGRAAEADRIEAAERDAERCRSAAAARTRTIRVELDGWSDRIFSTGERQRGAAESVLSFLVSLFD